MRHLVHVAAAAIALGGVAPLAALVMDDSNKVTVSGALGSATLVEPDSRITAYYDVVLGKQCDYSIQQKLVDRDRVTWPAMNIDLVNRPAGKQVIAFSRTVSHDAAGGPAVLRNRLVWSCNFMQDLFPKGIDLPDVGFVVVR